MRERLVLMAVCMLMAAGCILSGCGRRSGQSGGGGTEPEYRTENKKMIRDAVKIKEKYEDRIVDALEEIEPGQVTVKLRRKVNGIDYYTTFGVPKKIRIEK